MNIYNIPYDVTKLNCGLCKKLCEVPTMTRCQHLFCKVCIVGSEPLTCPTCQGPFKGKHLISSSIHQELIDKVKTAQQEALPVEVAENAFPKSLLLTFCQKPTLDILEGVLSAKKISGDHEENAVNQFLTSLSAFQVTHRLPDHQIRVIFRTVIHLLQIDGFIHPKKFIKNLLACMPQAIPLDLCIEGFNAFKSLLRRSPTIHEGSSYILYQLLDFIERPQFPQDLHKEFLSLIDSYGQSYKDDLLMKYSKLPCCNSPSLSTVVDIFLSELSKEQGSARVTDLLITRISSLLHYKVINEESICKITNKLLEMMQDPKFVHSQTQIRKFLFSWISKTDGPQPAKVIEQRKRIYEFLTFGGSVEIIPAIHIS